MRLEGREREVRWEVGGEREGGEMGGEGNMGRWEGREREVRGEGNGEVGEEGNGEVV